MLEQTGASRLQESSGVFLAGLQPNRERVCLIHRAAAFLPRTIPAAHLQRAAPHHSPFDLTDPRGRPGGRSARVTPVLRREICSNRNSEINRRPRARPRTPEIAPPPRPRRNDAPRARNAARAHAARRRPRAGRTRKPKSPCRNGRKDGDETDVDCGGGDCGPCEEGDKCDRDRDCEEPLGCLSGRCRFRPTPKPTRDPTKNPTRKPTDKPVANPSPTRPPTREPTREPTRRPTDKPTARPTVKHLALEKTTRTAN